MDASRESGRAGHAERFALVSRCLLAERVEESESDTAEQKGQGKGREPRGAAPLGGRQCDRPDPGPAQVPLEPSVGASGAGALGDTPAPRAAPPAAFSHPPEPSGQLTPSSLTPIISPNLIRQISRYGAAVDWPMLMTRLQGVTLLVNIYCFLFLPSQTSAFFVSSGSKGPHFGVVWETADVGVFLLIRPPVCRRYRGSNPLQPRVEEIKPRDLKAEG